jgi:AmmeMemoRadiSam system protein B
MTIQRTGNNLSDNLIPRLRHDLNFVEIEQNGSNYIFISDRWGYSEYELAITPEFYSLLKFLGDNTRYDELNEVLGLDDSESVNSIIENLQTLDDMYLMDSQKFRDFRERKDKEYLELKVRPYACAGLSYPEDRKELLQFLDELTTKGSKTELKKDIKGFIAPHLDLSLEDVTHSMYSSVFQSVADTDFDLLVILGTAHYDSSDLFMLSTQNYSTPLGEIETDTDFINLWQKYCPHELDFNELAHRPEHSIEYHVLLSQYFFQNKKFKILPILAGSFYEYIYKGSYPELDQRFTDYINSFKEALKYSGKKVIFAASADFAHIGRKFGDDFDAEDKLSILKEEDEKLISSIVKADKQEFFNKIINDKDKFKICGTTPIYSLFSLEDFDEGHFIEYNQWNDIASRSAVSIASFILT